MQIHQLHTISETEAKEIKWLAGQLGYENTYHLLFDRLKHISFLKEHAIFVAKIDGKIVGWLHCLICLRVESPVFVEVAGLVVNENVRGQHIGKKLIEASENWSRDQNISQILVRCNVVRVATHKFYNALGFSSNKEQKVFHKSLH